MSGIEAGKKAAAYAAIDEQVQVKSAFKLRTENTSGTLWITDDQLMTCI